MSTNSPYPLIVNTGADLSNTMYGSQHQAQYAEAAWLYTQFQTNKSYAGNINFAVWALFNSNVEHEPGWNGGTPSSSSTKDSAAWWYWDATQWYGQETSSQVASLLSSVRIYTPVTLNSQGQASGIIPAYSSDHSAPQEFITTAVPEPGSLALLGAGLFGLGVWRRTRARI